MYSDSVRCYRTETLKINCSSDVGFKLWRCFYQHWCSTSSAVSCYLSIVSLYLLISLSSYSGSNLNHAVLQFSWNHFPKKWSVCLLPAPSSRPAQHVVLEIRHHCHSHVFFFMSPSEPHFLHAIEYGNYVYFFFSEIAVEYTTLGKVSDSFETRRCVMFVVSVHRQVEWSPVASLHMQNYIPTRSPPPCWLCSGVVLYKQCDVLIRAVTCKEVFSSRPLRWFSPEWRAFVRTTTAVHRECWSVTGRRSSKPGSTAPSPATPSSTLMFCSRWQTCCRSTTGRPCSASSPRRPTGWYWSCWR